MKRTLIMLIMMIASGLSLALHAADVDEQYRVSSGDRLRISVYGHNDLSGEFEVDGAGQLSLPLIQDVDAEGKSLNELEQDITDMLKPDYLINPRVGVEILNYRPFYIVGEVKDPGSYAFVTGMTVINAVALAGGFTYRADKRDVKITRDRADEENEFSAKVDTVVMPGDVIEIGERFF